MAPSAVPVSQEVDIPTSKIQSLSVSDGQVSVLESALPSLKTLLSEKASVDSPSDAEFQIHAQRWSDFNGPTPGAVVNVACEEDISATIKWATSNKIPFFAQSGAHGFSSTLKKLDKSGIVINLRALNSISIDLPAGIAVLGAGALTSEVVEAAHKSQAHVMTGVCNSVGIVGALLGGGLGNLISLYGLGVDNIVSARLITAAGNTLTVSADENADLFWGIRGAGHNFGIVSQLTVKAYPEINHGVHWTQTLIFPGTEDFAKRCTQAVQDLGIGQKMGCTMLFGRMPPTLDPMIVVGLWYGGSEEEAHAAFAPLFALGHVMQMGGPTPYNKINAFSDLALAKGGRKPAFGVGLKETEIYRAGEAFKHWVDFTEKHPEAGHSVVLVEAYNYDKAREVDSEETAYPWRECGVHVFIAFNYPSAALDSEAAIVGERFRATLQPDTAARNVYVNFANGDEDPKLLYGSQKRLDRLRSLKAKYDPEGWFSLYNPIR